MSHILMIGVGQIGTALIQQLSLQHISTIAVSRYPRPDLAALTHVSHLVKDARHLSCCDLGSAADHISQLVIMVSPDQSDSAGYRASYHAISAQIIRLSHDLPQLKRVIFVSSTSVYGQNYAEMIDANTPPMMPISATAQVLMETEQLLQHAFDHRLTIVRPSGIYGPTRRSLIRLTERILKGETAPPNRWTNRIFADDLVHVLFNIIHMPQPLPLYLATDDEPTPLYQVLSALARLYFQVEFNLPHTSPLEGKRISSNVSPWLCYPNYYIGYAEIFKSPVH